MLGRDVGVHPIVATGSDHGGEALGVVEGEGEGGLIRRRWCLPFLSWFITLLAITINNLDDSLRKFVAARINYSLGQITRQTSGFEFAQEFVFLVHRHSSAHSFCHRAP